MNVLLLGNGFDLYYKLPTKYNNFLHTVDFLIKNNVAELDNIGQVFGSEVLQAEDEFIKESYEKYKDIYDNTLLDKDKMTELVNLTKDNIWFSYLLKSFNKDIGWIDFEKEISTVIRTLQPFLNDSSRYIQGEYFDEIDQPAYIVHFFNFYLINRKHVVYTHDSTREISPEYLIEYPVGSKNLIKNKKKIIDKFSEYLYILSKALKIYLKCFVDNTTEELFKQSYISNLEVINNNDAVVSFNYTNTYELFYPNVTMFHVHGNVNSEIVLGVNTDKNDKKETVNTSFVEFKKYYQRTYYGTDISYLRWLRELLDEGGGSEDIHLLIMGHSLDVTDEDYIHQLFGLASKINILYHNDDAKKQYIKNLISIFGEEKFGQIRDEQQLEFIDINSDLSKFCKERARNSSVAYSERMHNFYNTVSSAEF